MEARPKKHIVIAGMGFAGFHAYQTLNKRLTFKDNVEITFINKGDSFVFIPMIHEVGTGLLQPSAITQPLRLLPKRFLRDFVDGNVVSVQADEKKVLVERAEGFTETISYDYLILALGSTPSFMDIPGADEHAYTLRTLADARRLKNRVLEMFDTADAAYDEGIQKELIRFIVVGGGSTGVEIAGELSDLMSHEMMHAFPHLAPHGEVVLLDRGDRLMKESHPKTSSRAHCLLGKWKCVDVRTETSVQKVTAEGVVLNSGFLESRTVIWCVGMHAPLTRVESNAPIAREERTNRIIVNQFLHIPEREELFVVGDQARVTSTNDTRTYGMRAQFATEEGKHAAHNILAHIRGKRLKSFSWHDRGTIISLGKGGALAEIAGMRFSGIIARIIYRVAYLNAIVGIRAKLRTTLEWSLNFFTPRDISRI